MTTLTLPLLEIAAEPFAPTLSLIGGTHHILPLLPIAVGPTTETVHELALLPIEITVAPVVMAARPVPVPTPPGQVTRYAVHAVDFEGNIFATFPKAVVGPYTWPAVNAPMTLDVDIPIDDPGLAELPLPNRDTTPVREVQVWRNGALLFQGPPVARRANSRARVWTYNCQDPLYYFLSRSIGEGARHNFLPNGSFATMSGVTIVGPGLTGSVSSTQHLLGPTSLKLVGTTSDAETYAVETFLMHAGPIGLALIVTAWVFIEDPGPGVPIFPAVGERGLFIQRGPFGGKGDWFKVAKAFTADNATPVGKWSRLTCAVEMLPNTTELIQVRFYGTAATVYWDAATVTIEESLSFTAGTSPDHVSGWDQTMIARMTSRYLGGRMPVGFGYSKSNLRIGDAGSLSGITKERTYQFADHVSGYTGGSGGGALDEWTQTSDGFDFEVEMMPTARVFRTHYPSIGKVWPRPFVFHRGTDAEPGARWGVVGWDYGDTIEGAATDLVEVGGWGDGAGREEGSFADHAALGGLTRDVIESAPTDAPIDLLDAIAQSRGAQLAKPVSTPSLTLVEPRDPTTGEVLLTLIGVMKPGDIITPDIVDGSVRIDGTWRVASVAANPDETLTVGLAK